MRKTRSLREGSIINLVVQIGLALCMASSVVFHIRLYQLNSHLRSFYPQMWRLFGTGNETLNIVAKYNRMTQLSTQYEVNDARLNSKLVILRRLHQSAGIGAAIAVVGLALELLARS